MQAPPQTPDSRRALRAGLFSGLIGLGVLILVTLAVGRSAIDLDALRAIAGRTRLWLMAVSLLVMSVAFWFLGLRWRSLFPGPIRPPGTGLAAILCAGLLLNSALPGPVGEFGAAWFAHKRYQVTLGMALAAGMGARIIGLIVASLAAALCFAFWIPPIPETYRPAIEATAFLVGLMGLGLIVIAAKPGLMVAASRLSLGRFHRWQRLHQVVEEAAKSLDMLKAQGFAAVARCVAWSAVAHATVLFGIALAAWSLGATPSISGLLFTYATTTAALVVMFALPGSAVGWDAIFLTLLTTTAGLEVPDALAVAIVVRVQQLCIMCAGAAAMAWLARTGPVAEE
jgi:uncharacterized membrane protein YbhN (UPF0104 family)